MGISEKDKPAASRQMPLAPGLSEQDTVTTGKPSKFRHWFAIGLSVYFVLLLAAGGIAVFFLWKHLEAYEAQSPATAVSRYVDWIQRGEWEAIYAQSDFEPDRLNTKEQYMAYLACLYNGERESIRTAERVSDQPDTKQYNLYMGDRKVTTLTLYPEGTTWRVETALTYQEPVVLTASPEIQLTVNGVAMTDLGIEPVEVGETYFDGPRDAALFPHMRRYTVEGLLNPPEITAATADGQEAVPVEEEDGTLFYYPGNPDEQQEMLELTEKAAKAYTQYFSKDAPKADILNRIYKDTPLYDAVKQSSNYWYGPHSSFSYQSFHIYNLQQYTPDDFTVEVAMEYAVRFYTTRVYPLHYRMRFLRIDGEFRLVSMVADDKVPENMTAKK